LSGFDQLPWQVYSYCSYPEFVSAFEIRFNGTQGHVKTNFGLPGKHTGDKKEKPKGDGTSGD